MFNLETLSWKASTNNTCNECFAHAQVTQYHEDFHTSYSFPYEIVYNEQNLSTWSLFRSVEVTMYVPIQ
jgi:hypothetical protein